MSKKYITVDVDKYIRDQKAWLKLTGIKEGDRVRIIAKADSFQCGWPTVWTSLMDGIDEGVVEEIDEAGILLRPCLQYFPFFVLAKYE